MNTWHPVIMPGYHRCSRSLYYITRSRKWKVRCYYLCTCRTVDSYLAILSDGKQPEYRVLSYQREITFKRNGGAVIFFAPDIIIIGT